MKTNFHQKNKFFQHNRAGKKHAYLLPSLCVVLLIILFSFSAVRSVFFDLVTPVWRARDAVENALADSFLTLQSKQALIAQNQSLQLQLADNAVQLELNKVLQSENTDLKVILNRKSQNQKQILAAILNKPSFSPYDTLIIDAGSAEGISVNDSVVASGTVPIGFISEVYTHTAKVLLYSSSGQTTNVLIGSDHLEKQAIGLGNGNFSVQMPRESTMQVGDPIVIPSISPNIFATVAKIEFKETDSFQTVLFTIPVNIATLAWVEVIPAAH